DMIEAETFFHSQKYDGVAVFGSTDFRRPEYFHEITRLRLGKIVKILPDAELIEKARRSRSIRIPASPNSLAIALPANQQLLQRREIESELPAIAQSFD